ncbi:hypothetical protein PENTCL1PPCAC_12160, partial [Pristionchus entomophagus]
MRRIKLEPIDHLFDWHKSSLRKAIWVSRVKLLRKELVPTFGLQAFPNLYFVNHVYVYKKPSYFTSLPTEIYGSHYSSLVIRAKVDKDYLVCG